MGEIGVSFKGFVVVLVVLSFLLLDDGIHSVLLLRGKVTYQFWSP